MQNVAIIGAGMAGVVLARHLGSRANVELFEKSRGPSGRLATRRCQGFEFDHGAQFFTARDPRFSLFLEPYLRSGLVKEWKPRLTTFAPGVKPYKRDWFEPHYVAVPCMNALVKELGADLSLRTECTVTRAARHSDGWWLSDQHGEAHGPFDWVVSTCPVVQTQALFPDDFLGVEAKLQACFALMLGFENRPKARWEAAAFQSSLLGWASWNDSKPGRDGSMPALVVLSDNAWAEAHLETPLEEVRALMLAELRSLTGVDGDGADVAQIHRWRYANASAPVEESFLLHEERRLAVCGDWCLANRVEAAFLSAARLGNRLHGLIPHS